MVPSLFTVVGLLLGFIIFGYTQLDMTSPQVTGVRPALDTSVDAVAQAGFRLLVGDLPGAAEAVLHGVELSMEVDVANAVSLPLFIPSMEHRVLLNGVEVTEPVKMPGRWLGMGSTDPVSFDVLILTDRLDDTALAMVLAAGDLDLEVETRLGLGPVSLTRRTEVFQFSPGEAVRTALERLRGG